MSDDKRLERIENKIDTVVDHVGELKVVASANLESLKAHMRRTAILEQIVVPMERERQQIKGILKFIGLVALIGGIIESIVLFLSFIKDIHV